MLFEQLGIDVSYIVIGLVVVVLVLLILLMVFIAKCSKLKKNYDAFLSGKDAQSLEALIQAMVKDVKTVKKSNQIVEKTLAEVLKEQKDCYKKIGMVRYDAFKGLNGKLSFTLGLLDGMNNGFLLNCMYGNDGCYVYMKEILHGEAMIALSSEERKALDEALKCDKIA